MIANACEPDAHAQVEPSLFARFSIPAGRHRIFGGQEEGLHLAGDSRVCFTISADGLFNESLAVRQQPAAIAPSYFGAMWLPTGAVRPGDFIRGYAVFRTRPSPYSTRLVLENGTGLVRLVDSAGVIAAQSLDPSIPMTFFNISTSKYLTPGWYELQLRSNNQLVATEPLEIVRYQRPDIKIVAKTSPETGVKCVVLPGSPMDPQRAIVCSGELDLDVTYFHGTPVTGKAKASLVQNGEVITDCSFTPHAESLYSVLFNVSQNSGHRVDHAFQKGTMKTAISCAHASIHENLLLQVDVEDTMSRKGFAQLPLQTSNAIYHVKLSASNGTLFAEIDVNPQFSRSEWLRDLNVSFGLFHRENLQSKESTVSSLDVPRDGPVVVNCSKYQAIVTEFRGSVGKSWCVRLRQRGVVVSALVCSESFDDKQTVVPAFTSTSGGEAVQPGVASAHVPVAPQLSIAMATSKPLFGGEIASGKISLAANCSFFKEIQGQYPNVFVDVITDGLSDSIAVPVNFESALQQCTEAQRASVEMTFDFDVPEDYQGGLDLEGYFHPTLMIHSPHFDHHSLIEDGQRTLQFSPSAAKTSAIVLPPSFLRPKLTSSQPIDNYGVFTMKVQPKVGTGQPINVQVDINEEFFNNAVNSSKCALGTPSALWFAVALTDERLLAGGHTPVNLSNALRLQPDKRPEMFWAGSIRKIAEGRAEVHAVDPTGHSTQFAPTLRIFGNFPENLELSDVNVSVGGLPCNLFGIEALFEHGPARALICNMYATANQDGKVPIEVRVKGLPAFGSLEFEWADRHLYAKPRTVLPRFGDREEGVILGIDLGTMNSHAAVFLDGRVHIIPHATGNRHLPSTVAFHDTLGILAGFENAGVPEAHTVSGVKRLIGKKYSEVLRELPFLSYQVVDDKGAPSIKIDDEKGSRYYSPQAITSLILQSLKESAEAYLGRKVTQCVISVPAFFNDAQRQATKDAATMAGLNTLRLINEPTAGAIAYGLQDMDNERNVLVYSLGGGTFDVSVLGVDFGVFEVLATNGASRLGGLDYDHRLMTYLLSLPNTPQDAKFRPKLLKAVQRAKHVLSVAHVAKIEVEHDGKEFNWEFTRAKFEELTKDLSQRTMDYVGAVLKDANLTVDQIHEVVLLGGATRMPHIKKLLKDLFKDKPFLNGINPDEAVATGCAIQASILAGMRGHDDILLLDVTPLSLGVRVGGVYQTIIPRNSVIPSKRSVLFTTQQDGQTALVFEVFQGERESPEDNWSLGVFSISLPPAPQGIVQIEVTMEIDANGIIHVRAEDKATGKAESLTITNDKARLSEEEISRMIAAAMAMEEEGGGVEEHATTTATELEMVIRTEFPDAIVLEPKLVKERSFNITVPPTDSITSYRLYAMLVAEKEAHVIESSVLVSNRVFSATNNPPFMTLGDELWISTVVENIGDAVLTNVNITASPNEHIDVLGCEAQSGRCMENTAATFAELGPGQMMTVNWKVRAKLVGDAELITTVMGLDAARRQMFLEVSKLQAPLYIGPPGSPVVDLQRVSLAPTRNWTFTPDLSQNGHAPVFALGVVSMLPSLDVAVLDGVEALETYPYGCCEQTSASTLPNIVAYRYLKLSNKLTPEIKGKLLANMKAGRDRYLQNFYNPKTGGFGLWSGESTSTFHTALATGVLGALSDYVEVDPLIFDMARTYLANNMEADGSFGQSGGIDGLFPSTLTSLATSTYVCHSLSLGKQAIEPTISFLIKPEQRAALTQDSAALAMVVDTISRLSDILPQAIIAELPQLIADLKSLMHVNEKSQFYWARGSGLTSAVETTAYALSALARTETNQTILRGGANFLIDKRTSHGWQSTRDTVFAAMALSDIASATPKIPGGGKFVVRHGQKEVAAVTLTEENMHVALSDLRNIFLDQFDLTLNPSPMANEIVLEWQGANEVHVVVEVRKWYERAGRLVLPSPLVIEENFTVSNGTTNTLSVHYELTPNPLNNLTDLQAIMLEQKIPAGCVVQSGALARLKATAGVDHVEVNTQEKQPHIGVFFSSLDHLRASNQSLRVEFAFDATHHGTVDVEGLRVLFMYEPESSFSSLGFQGSM